MAATYKVAITINGLKELRKLLTPPENLYGGAWRSGMTSIVSRTGLAAQRAAPVGSGADPHIGRLQGSVRTRMDKRPFPMWAVVSVTGRTRSKKYPRGYPYPRLLEFSPKHGRQSWLINAAGTVWRGAEQVLGRIGDAIARQWSST